MRITWGSVARFNYGRSLPSHATRGGPSQVFGTNGPTGWTGVTMGTGPTVVIGRKGAYRGVHLARDAFWVIDTAFYMEPNPTINPVWAYYCFKQYDINAMDAGSAIPSTRRQDLEALPLDLPDLPTQTAIADVLGALDDKIAANEQVIRLSEDLLCTRFLRECDQADETRLVSDIVDLNPARPKPRDEQPVYVEMKDLGTHTSVITSWSRRAPMGGVRFKRGDTVIGRITPCLENGKVGYVDFLSEDATGVGSTEFIAMSARNGLPKPLSFLLAEHPGFRQEAVQLMVGTSGRQRVSARDLGDIELQLPDDNALRELGRASEAIFEMLARLRNENRSLAATRDALLPALMSGRLTVSKCVEAAAR